jgi:general secretion pathway protein K
VTSVPTAPSGGRSRGFALLIVLWALVLLALIVTELGASGRVEAQIARNLVSSAEAEAAADGAVYHAIFRLSDGSDQGWQADGTTRQVAIGPFQVEVQIEDEAGKVNPNGSSPELLRALLVAVGATGEQAQALTQAIVDWRGGGGISLEQQAAVIQQYQAAGLKYQPSFAPFETVDDMRLVLGMPPDLAARLRPHLSVTQIGAIDPTHADPVVAQALRQLPSGPGTAPPIPLAYRSVAIRATAPGRAGARFTRRATVRLGPGLPRGYSLLTWETVSD